MIKIIISLVLALLIGAACRVWNIPVPSPPRLIGAVLVVVMTLGYTLTDRLMPKTTNTAAATSIVSDPHSDSDVRAKTEADSRHPRRHME
jgi:XapX domain-containing protein